jgi:2-polyprenyl-3-methyl-5-hydroxy-6-metoxy-1,4-benzoquinol methylase
MSKIFDGIKVFDIDPSSLRSENFYKDFIVNERARFWETRSVLNKKLEDAVCFVCGNKENNILFLEHDGYLLCECSHCSAVFANIDISDEYEKIVYDNDFYNDSIKREVLDTYEYRKNKFGKERLEYIAEKCKFDIQSHSLLDLGCGPGYFLKYLDEQGVECKGLELTDFLVDVCCEQNLNVTKTMLEDEKDSSYNIITMFDVLEHLSKPIDFFETLNKKIKSNGYVLAYTPNIHSFAFNFQKGKQNLLLPYEHLCFHNKESLSFVANKTGFEIVSIECFGLDIVDYFSMKEYEDGIDYNDKLKEIIPYMQALIDKTNISNHMRIIMRKTNE